ncbi:Ankyrin repeat protein [Legionella steigerwaltii]|uniref:Ankyrin repeat protein n=1 Tax=Legionella steigerwaltii TaxID=460 RepID=A0A378LK42_9GAMM|nr:ankyrin repeat domain-containing protein [Legionella steigerwaltii]KTD77811.1 Ankyrin repeat protein [Legionella steigerwaltii]STY24451.1 Ankyrin repeat protein [Legionella steigerwaltii]
MNDIYYWRHIFGDDDLLVTYKAEIEQLLAGDYKSLSLEKLHGVSGISIYSIRVNRETRLLFTAYKEKLCLLDVVYNHDYHKNRYLRNPGLLKAFLAKLDNRNIEIQLNTEKLSLSTCRSDELEQQLPNSKEKGKVIAIDYYKQDFILLSEQQEHAFRTKLPAIIYGPAGSGKTCVAFFTLKDYIQQVGSQEGTFPVLYVSRSNALVAEMKAQWVDSVTSPQRDLVSFLTYDELFSKHLVEKRGLADDQYFGTWLVQAIKQPKYKLFDKTLNSKVVWHEFRICSGYTNNDYLNLGSRQSSITKEQRQLIVQLYRDYQSGLIQKNYLSTELSPITSKASYSLILVDEAQDFSYGQLENLYNLAQNGHIVYFLGDHQVLFDGKSRLPYLRQMAYAKNRGGFSEHQLSSSYRCSKPIIEVTNTLIKLKYQVTGGAADKAELGQIVSTKEDKDKGELHWIDSKSSQLKALQEEAKHTNFAVITFPEFIEEAKRALGTPLVFTPEEIKGLEYDTVLVWRPLDVIDSSIACTKLKERQDQTLAAGHRAKAGEADETCLPYFNRLITSVTRARRRLIFVQDKQHPTQIMHEALQTVFSLETKSQVLSPIDTVFRSTEQDWEEEARKLLRQGNEAQARNIFLETLGSTEEKFKEFQQTMTKPFVVLKPAENVLEEKAVNSVQPKTSKKKKKEEVLKPQSTTANFSILPPLFTPPTMTREEKAQQELMADFSEKRLTVVLSIFPLDILLQTPATSKQTLWQFILSDINRTKLFTKVIVNDHKITEKFIQANRKQLNFFINRIDQNGKEIRDHLNKLNRVINDLALIFHARKLYTPTLAYVATLTRNIARLRDLHQLGADFNKTIDKEVTLPFVAADCGFADVLENLYQYGADLNKTTGGVTPAHIAAQKGHVKIIEKLYQCGADLNAATAEGMTPAFVAAQEGHAAVIEKLHEYGADLNKADDEGFTPAFIAAQDGHVEVIEQLGKSGADLNKANVEGFTPAFVAAQEGHAAVIEKLHEYGADLNKANVEGFTPAIVAAQNGQAVIIEKLHECGADLNKASIDGSTPIHIAIKRDQIDVIKTLDALGANFNQPKRDGMTTAYIAVQKGNISVIRLLLEKKVNFDSPYLTNKNDLFKFLNIDSRDIKSSNQKNILLKIDRFIKRQGNKGDSFSILPIELAEIMERQDIIDLIKSYQTQSRQSYSFFTLKNSSEEVTKSSIRPEP